MERSRLEVIQLSSETTVGTFGDVLLVQFRGPTLPDCLGPMTRGRKAIALRHPRFTCVAVIEPESPPPGQEARTALMQFFAESAPTLDGLVVVYGVEGFRGAMVRTVASSVLDLMPRARFNFPRNIVRTPEEGASVVHKYSPAVDTAAMLGALRDLRAMPAASRC